MKKILFLILPCLLLAACTSQSTLRFIPNAGQKEVGDANFEMRSNLNCEILIDTNPQEVNKKLSFADLDTINPKLYYQENRPLALDKLYEENGRVVLQIVSSGNASVDTFLIDKETGIFSRTNLGDFWGPYAMAAKGICHMP